jgi:hypothetical protein
MATEESFELLVGVTGGVSGPVVAVAAGGTLAEVLDDAATALCPVPPSTAERLLRRLCCWPVLQRGLPDGGPLDEAADCAVVAAVSEVAARLAGRLVERDHNPVLVHRAGPVSQLWRCWPARPTGRERYRCRCC